MRRTLAGLALLGLAGCSSPGEPPPPDTCGARPLQSLIGRPRSEAPVPVRPELQRVMCTTCPATMDYNEERLNILFDATTGLIREIRCG